MQLAATDGQSRLNTVEVFDPISNEWWDVAPMNHRRRYRADKFRTHGPEFTKVVYFNPCTEITEINVSCPCAHGHYWTSVTVRVGSRLFCACFSPWTKNKPQHLK